MTEENIDRAKQNANDVEADTKDVVADLRENAATKIADGKAVMKKARADVANTRDHVMAELTADVAKLKADAHEDGVERAADYVQADINEGVDKANANMRHDAAYAKADADKLKPHDKPRQAYRPKETTE